LAIGAIRQWFGGAARVTHRQGRLCYYFQHDFGIAIGILFRHRPPAPPLSSPQTTGAEEPEALFSAISLGALVIIMLVCLLRAWL
jgi:hypothetical protein